MHGEIGLFIARQAQEGDGLATGSYRAPLITSDAKLRAIPELITIW